MVMVAACIIPVAAYPLILAYYHQTGRTKMSAVLAGIASSAFLYGYIADQGNDIYRHIQNLNYYVGIPLYKAFDAAFLKTVYVNIVVSQTVHFYKRKTLHKSKSIKYAIFYFVSL